MNEVVWKSVPFLSNFSSKTHLRVLSQFLAMQRCLPGFSTCSWATLLVFIPFQLWLRSVPLSFYDCFSNCSHVFLLYKIWSKWKHQSKCGLNIQFIQQTQLSDLSFNVKGAALVGLITARTKFSFVTFQKVGKSNKNLLNYLQGFAAFLTCKQGTTTALPSEPAACAPCPAWRGGSRAVSIPPYGATVGGCRCGVPAHSISPWAQPACSPSKWDATGRGLRLRS